MQRAISANVIVNVVKRSAVILCSKITADCPLNADCLSIDEETKRKTLCGHYAGSVTGRDGSQVYCEYCGGSEYGS